MDICIDLVEKGIELRYNPISQLLQTIVVYDITKGKYEYSGHYFVFVVLVVFNV